MILWSSDNQSVISKSNDKPLIVVGNWISVVRVGTSVVVVGISVVVVGIPVEVVGSSLVVGMVTTKVDGGSFEKKLSIIIKHDNLNTSV